MIIHPLVQITNLHRIRSDFIETVATGYRPGIIHFGDDDFCVSISIPVITLAHAIPPRALMAWDRRLLSQSQYLTLLISGFHGHYPPINDDGTYITTQHSGVNLTFKVGLTKKYKPGKEQAREAGRAFGLITQDAEDAIRIQAEKAAALEAMEFDFDADGNMEPNLRPQIFDEPDEEDEGRFDRFSLSSSLESLLDHNLMKIIQLRMQFGLGWAGAEVLFAEMEKSQTRPEAACDAKRLVRAKHLFVVPFLIPLGQEILRADEEERELGRTNELPHDPLSGLNNTQAGINITLTAFCYLIRRLSVRTTCYLTMTGSYIFIKLCPRYCIVCHNKLSNDFEALKPYVCDSKLCAYRYYTLNQGPSLEAGPLLLLGVSCLTF